MGTEKPDLTGTGFQDERLSIQQQHLSLPKYCTKQRSEPGKGHTQPYAKKTPAVFLPIHIAAPVWNAYNIKQLGSVREMQFRETHLIDSFSEITQISSSVIAFISFCGYIHKHPT